MTKNKLDLQDDIDKYFCNRQKELKPLNNYAESLYDDISFQLLVMGYKGVGKTFLLKKFLNNQQYSILSVYLDLDLIYNKYDNNLSEDIFFKELMLEINKTIFKQVYFYEIKPFIMNQLNFSNYEFTNGKDIRDIPLDEINANYSNFCKFAMQLPQKIVDFSDELKGFIIVIDEFQLFKYLNNSEAFFWLIRSFSQTQSNVSYIFTGSTSKKDEIAEMINGKSGAFGDRLMGIVVEPFTLEETKIYLNTKFECLSFTEEGFKIFYEYTRGIPTNINLLASIFDVNNVIDSNLFKITFRLKFDQIEQFCLSIWNSLYIGEREILKKIIQNEQLTLEELISSLNYSNKAVNKYLGYLIDRGIVTYENKKYVVTDQLLNFRINY